MDCKRTEIIYDERQKESDLINVLFVCDEWKSSKGGLSTLNRELAIHLAKTTSNNSTCMKIYCYVAKSDDRDRRDAEKHKVNLIPAEKVPGSRIDPLDCLKIPPQEIRVDVVVSHGRKFGVPAYFIKRNTKCKWIQFLHVCCEDLGKYKNEQTAGEDSIQDNEDKHRCELELCKVADAVVAVGPELQSKYKRYLPQIDVHLLTPGTFESFQPARHVSRFVGEGSQSFHVFVFGRVNFEDLGVKGLDIIAEAVASLGRSFKLVCVGSPPGQQKEFEKWFLGKTGIALDQLTIRRYCSQEELMGMFREAQLVALPSRVEGFGIIAVEAISAGVPILISRQSGLSRALQKVEGGDSVTVNSEKPEEWANSIREMALQTPQQRHKNALRLRENYRKIYSWERECDRFISLIERVLKGDTTLAKENNNERQNKRDSCKKTQETQALKTPLKELQNRRTESFVDGSDAIALQEKVQRVIDQLLGPFTPSKRQKLRWGDISLEKEAETGKEMLVFKKESAMRGYRPVVKVTSVESHQCPVEIYKAFKSHRPRDMNKSDSPFYLAVKRRRPSSDNVWYMRKPLGRKFLRRPIDFKLK